MQEELGAPIAYSFDENGPAPDCVVFFLAIVSLCGIRRKVNAIPKGFRTLFRDEPEQDSAHS